MPLWGRWREAVAHFRSGLLQFQQIGLPSGESQALVDLGAALIELRETEEARSCLRRALAFGDAADASDLKIAQRLLDSLPAE